MELQGLLNAVFDEANNAIRVSGSGDSIFLSPGDFVAVTGTPAASTANGVRSLEFDGAATESALASFVVPTFWSSINVDIIWGRRAAGSGNVRHRTVIKDLAAGNLVSEAAVSDVSANVAVPTQDAVAFREHVSQLAVGPNRLFSISYERTAADAGDTFNSVDSSLFGIQIRRGI